MTNLKPKVPSEYRQKAEEAAERVANMHPSEPSFNREATLAQTYALLAIYDAIEAQGNR